MLGASVDGGNRVVEGGGMNGVTMTGRMEWRRNQRSSGRAAAREPCKARLGHSQISLANDVKVFDGRFAAFGLIACLHATSACSSRATTATTVITPDQPVPPRTPAPVATGNPEGLPPDHETDECAVIAAPGQPLATVALPDRIDPSNAPRPSNESERLLFRQLYETLVRVDCMGHVRPGLAASWRLDADGRTWIVTLRENARFADGTPVTADLVRASWIYDAGGDVLRPDVGRLVQSVVAVNDRTLAVLLLRPQTEAPIALAHPDLAIAKLVAGSSWPVGTRSGRITAVVDEPPAKPASALTITRDDLTPIRFLPASGDPRDFLDAGVDLLLTRDPAALDYARTLPQFQLVPLAWQRTHLLLVPDRSRPLSLQSEQARQRLAADAVRGEARGAQAPFWWQMLADCEVSPASPRSQSSPAPRIVFDANDGAARDLAERFVGLGTYERATGLTGRALAQARRLGTDGGYLMSVDSRPVDPCRDLHDLMEAAPWLDPEAIVPLVETRLQAIVRRGRTGISTEWDGGITLAGDMYRRQR
jgi:Bacterial extracellular solute-binding proteins, family 5 Middle